jgi:hypothetical protein
VQIHLSSVCAAAGEPGIPEQCGIAKAILAQTKADAVSVYPELIVVDGKGYPVAPEAAKWMRAYDKGEKVWDMWFDLGLPDSLEHKTQVVPASAVRRELVSVIESSD